MRTSILRAGLVAAVCLVLGALSGAPATGAARAPLSGYFSVQPDLRLCPAPNCGGFFVALLNRQSVGCPGGRPGAMCRVTAIDWSRLGLDPAARSDFEKAALAGRAVVRGELQRGAGPRPTARLVVTEGWIAAGSRLPRGGGFFQVASNGIVCVTYPCFSWRQTLLNTNRRGEVSDVNLLGAGAPEASRNAAWTELESGSILVAGRLRNVPNAGPAGDGVELVASQFYLRVGGS